MEKQGNLSGAASGNASRSPHTAVAEGALRVWWIPQVPMKAFRVPVLSPHEARKFLDVLGRYDAFQFENKLKPDYCNAGGLEVFEGGEWCDWEDENGDDIDATVLP